MEPSFFLSYWRPWEENSSFIDSWGDYLRDTSLIDYGANKIGSYIQQASREQSYAIEEASKRQLRATVESAKMQAIVMQKIGAVQVEAIQKAATMIGYQLEDAKKELGFLNRRMDIVIEQQRVGLMLQNNIAQLLKIPDSEKERQQAITLGIQFFVNAAKDPDLFDDALEEFLKAESMKKQDYFVLHRIGCIYMFTQKHLDVPKALDYFLRAAKYSVVESDPSALRLANILTNSINTDYTKNTSDPKSIQLLAADSYEKAALAYYVLGNDITAIEYQKKAISLNSNPDNCFKLGKYLVRSGNIAEGVKQLNRAIDRKPELMDAILSDIDTAGNSRVLDLVNKKVREVDSALEELFEATLFDGRFINKIASELYYGDKLPYANRIQLIRKANKELLISPSNKGELPATNVYIKSGASLGNNDIEEESSDDQVYPYLLSIIKDGLQDLIDSNRIKPGQILNFSTSGEHEHLLPQVIPISFIYHNLKEDVIDFFSIKENDMNPCLFLPFKKESSELSRFKNCSVFSLFQQMNETQKDLADFESYVSILSDDLYKASETIANVLFEYNKLDNTSIHNLKITIG